MKTLFQIKETSASSVRHCCRVLSLIAALTAFSSSAWATTYYLLGSTSGENPTGWTVLATSSTPSFNYTTKHGNQWMGISESNNPADRYDTNGKTFVNNCTAQVWNYGDKEWGGQHMIWLNINGANDINISYANNTYTISDAAVELSITNVRTLTNQVWVTFDQNIGSTGDWTVSDYQTNTHPFDQIRGVECGGKCLYFWIGTSSSTKNNIYKLEYQGSCFLVTLNGYPYASDINCTTCSSSCAPSVNISSVTCGDKQLTVNWSVTGMTPTSQTIQYKAGSGAYQNGPAVAANATSATITGLTNGTEYTIKVTATDGTDSPFAEQTGTPSAQLLLPVLTGSGQTRQNNNELFVVIDGYPSTTYPQNKDKYSYENVSGTPAIDRIQDAAAGYLYFVLYGSTTSGERVYKITCTENNACAKLTFANGETVPTVGSCSEAPTPTETPIVYWEKYPTIGNNTIDMFGYLAERYCSNVTEAGFYWKETNDITADDIENPATNHKFTATTNPAKNNDSFSRTTPNLSEIITEPTTIYLVNYVTTAGGGTGISDVVALAYKPCFPIPDGGVTLNKSSVSLPEGYKFTFEVTARSAGKTPKYEWFLDGSGTKIEGAVSNVYEFTMPDASNHTLKVRVTGDCDVYREVTASITSCTMPAVTLAADASTTPWANVTITATPTAIATAQWSVTPNAELNSTSTSGATFRAGTPGKYTVKYVGASSACDATVNAEAEIEITVNADSEDCVNPNAE